MQAIVYDKTQSPRLALREVEKPVPQGSQVLVRIHAVSVNAADYRSMRMGIIPPHKIYGADIAGRVEAAGPLARKFQVGDEVTGEISNGGFAEYAAASEAVLARKPSGISYEAAAATPMAALTALQALRDRGSLRPGQRVLVYGAGGGVGTFAVQIARHLGAQVTAVCGPNNVELAQSLGAHRVVDYTRADILRGGEQFDLILGVNGSQPLSAYRRALAQNGIFVMVGGGLGQIFQSLVFGRLLSLGSKKMRFLSARSDASDLAWVLELIAQGQIRPVIDRCYPLRETAEAVRYAAQGHARGKVVIQVA